MTTLEFASYNKDDNIVELSAEEQLDYSTQYESLNNMNAVIGLMKFTCPTTLEQLWKEIDNLTEDNDNCIKNAQVSWLKYLTPGKYDSLLHVYVTPSRVLDYNKIVNIDRSGDLVLGVICQMSGPVEIYVGGVHKFTKECNAGFNAFSRDEVVPMVALPYHTISMKGKYVTNIIYATILHTRVRNQLVDFYAIPNPSMYVAQNGVDIDVMKK